jgi:aminoglycoside N3'-acetyltransferase
MKIEDKIYKLGLRTMDELLLHRNVSKQTEITLEDASVLSDFIVHVGPHAIFTFSEEEIEEFYRRGKWVK